MAALHPEVPEDLRALVRETASFLRPWLATLWVMLAEVRTHLYTLPTRPRPPRLHLRGERWRPVLLQMLLTEFAPQDRDDVRERLTQEFEAMYARAGKTLPQWLRDWTVEG